MKLRRISRLIREMGKAEYQREYQKDRYAQFQDRKEVLATSVFGGKCFLCPARYQGGRPGFHFHHVEYHPTESDYPRNSKAMSTRWKRLMEAEQHPERFRLLCSRCHRMIEAIISLLGADVDLDQVLSCIPR